MRFTASILVSIALSAAASAEPSKSPDADIDFLITSAAKDFGLRHPPTSVRFRQVRIGRIPLSEGEIQPLLCGYFQTLKAQWVPFATIKTSDYEQWTGATAKSFCENVSVVWVDDLDLTSRLQRTFDAPR